MKLTKKILISCATATVLATSSYGQIINSSQGSSVTVNSTDKNLTITNTGSISTTSSSEAVTVNSDAGVFLITNNGSISSINNNNALNPNNSAILLKGSVNGSIVNNGTISASHISILKYTNGIKADILNMGSSIINNGTISVTGTATTDHNSLSKDGILLINLNGDIINTGTITALNNAIRISGNQSSGNITNSATGIINADTALNLNNFAGNINNAGVINTSLYTLYDRHDFTGSFINSGTINGGTIDMNTLSGTLSNSGAILTTGNHYSIKVNTLNGDIQNSATGVITASSAADAIAIVTMNSGSTISNEGIINVSQSHRGIDVNSMSGTITNSGLITVDNGNSGSCAIAVSELDGSITNSGTITALDTQAISINGVGSGTITNSAGGVINARNAIQTLDTGYTGNIDNAGLMNTYKIYAPTASLTNSGTIRLSGSEVSQLSTYSQTASGKLSIGLVIAADGNSASYSKIKTTGAISLANGSTIDVDVTGNGAESLWKSNVGTVSDILETTSSIITADLEQLNITDNSALLDFTAELNTDNTKLSLTTQQAQTVQESVQHVGLSNSSIIAAARVFDNVQSGRNADIDRFRSSLNTLGTNEEISRAIDETLPTVASATANVSSQVIGAVSAVVQARQSSVRGLSSGDDLFSNKNIWFKPFGSYANQKDKDGINGFTANSYGFGIGIDGEYKGANRVGVSLFYTNVDVDTNSVTQSNNIDVVSLVAYGSNPIVDDKTLVDYQFGGSLQYSDSSRYITTTTQTAVAKYTAKNFYAQAKVLRDIEIGQSFRLIPGIKGAYSYFDSPSYSETGAGGLGLDVKSFNSEALIAGVESTLIYGYNSKTNLQVNLGVDYDFINDVNSVSSGYQGTPGISFNTNGIKNSATILQAGVGVDQVLAENLDFTMNYDFSSRGSDFTNHMLSAKFNYKF